MNIAQELRKVARSLVAVSVGEVTATYDLGRGSGGRVSSAIDLAMVVKSGSAFSMEEILFYTKKLQKESDDLVAEFVKNGVEIDMTLGETGKVVFYQPKEGAIEFQGGFDVHTDDEALIKKILAKAKVKAVKF